MHDITSFIRQEIPVKSFVVTAFICCKQNKKAKYLIIKRNSNYLKDTWQIVTGRVEKGETGWQAVLREIREETGLKPKERYSANKVEMFYEVEQNCINLCPIFVAFAENDTGVKLSQEHKDFKWVTAKEAKKYFVFDSHNDTIDYIERCFVKKTPNEFLKVKY